PGPHTIFNGTLEAAVLEWQRFQRTGTIRGGDRLLFVSKSVISQQAGPGTDQSDDQEHSCNELELGNKQLADNVLDQASYGCRYPRCRHRLPRRANRGCSKGGIDQGW